MKQLLPLATLFGIAACSQPQEQSDDAIASAILVDVPSLIGANQEQVDTALGTPECHEESGNLSCEYGGYNSAYFVNGSAANLTLPRVDDLQAYNLILKEPNITGPEFERWNTQVSGRPAEVSRFGDYVYIMTYSP